MATRLRTLFLATALGGGLSAIGCNTGAIGVQECREIEFARCEASLACGTIDDVEACQRFYHGHCLHGIAGPTAPSAVNQKKCVEAIVTAGSCAKKDPEADPTECEGLSLQRISGAHAWDDICDVVGRPWDLTICDYVNAKIGAGGGEG